MSKRTKILSPILVVALTIALVLTFVPFGQGLVLKASNYVSVSLNSVIRVGDVYAADPIDVGVSFGSVGDADAYVGFYGYYTYANATNPASDDATITDLKIWVSLHPGVLNLWVGSFSASGNVLTCHDSESVGDIPAGSEQTVVGVDIEFLSGEYIGCSAKATTTDGTAIERFNSGYDGMWSFVGERIDPSDSGTFIWNAGDAISIYGESTAGGCSEDISNASDMWDVNSGTPVAVSSEYATGLDYFAVTNSSGGAVTITIQGEDLIGDGDDWTLSDTATAGNMTYGLKAGLNGDDYNIIVKKTEGGGYNTLVANLADSGSQKWGLEMYTPTVYTNGNDKTGVVTITATCD